jgi:plastocyanin
VVVALAAILAVPATSQGGRVRIKATDQKTWNPAFKSVPKGTKVIWKNPTNRTHTVTAYKGSWSKDTTIKPGEKTSKIFRHRGAFYYRCTIHSSLDGGVCDGSMCGHVHVN